MLDFFGFFDVHEFFGLLVSFCFFILANLV